MKFLHGENSQQQVLGTRPSLKSDHGQKLWSLHSSFLLSDPKVAQTNRLQQENGTGRVSRNSQESHIHTTGHVRHLCKFLHHIVQSRLSALQLMREVVQHAGEEEEEGGGQQTLYLLWIK